MKNLCIIDVRGTKFLIAPNSIAKIYDFGNHTLLETTIGFIYVECEKLIIENSIHNCYLP